MTRLVRAEFLKLRTTQVWFWLLLADVAVGALIVIGSLASNAVKNANDVPDIFATANGALLFVVVLGILGVTTEYRYQTITPTLLATPSRWTLVTAKFVTYALVGFTYAVACLAVQLAIAVPWLSAKNITFDLGSSDLQQTIISLPAVSVLFAIIGVGIGALIRNQVLALTLSLVFLLVIQNLVAAIPGVLHLWNYLPAGATTAILYPHNRTGPGGIVQTSAATGFFVLLLWAVIPAALGAAVSMNRDIT
jgi:hypothetical protein